jgi:hypothetical protein
MVSIGFCTAKLCLIPARKHVGNPLTGVIDQHVDSSPVVLDPLLQLLDACIILDVDLHGVHLARTVGVFFPHAFGGGGGFVEVPTAQKDGVGPGRPQEGFDSLETEACIRTSDEDDCRGHCWCWASTRVTAGASRDGQGRTGGEQ